MASITMATLPLPPNLTTESPLPAKPLFFPPKRFKTLKPLLASPLEGPTDNEPESSDALKLARAKAEAYRNSKNSKVTSGDVQRSGDSALEVPDSVKLAMEKAMKYKRKKGGSKAGSLMDSMEKLNNSGQEELNVTNTSNGSVTGKGGPKISSTDFLGLGFSEKKSYRGMPPGLAPVVEPLSEGEVPEVEFIVGDASKFDVTAPSRTSSNEDAESMGLYKPKVSTWGVFPRPSNISKTFGGGKVIQPGEVLERVEDKAAKEKRSRELIAAYKSKRGLNIDAKTKLECEKALKEGDDLMDLGKLREALPYYEKVMANVIFQNELHGLAALQWSICQDSLRRPKEARVMYEKLQSHPNVQVSKKARQFVFSFQAMEMMKVKSSYSRKTGYENYFEAFVENKANYTPKEEEESEGSLREAFPYIMFLLSPIFIVFFIAVRKSF